MNSQIDSTKPEVGSDPVSEETAKETMGASGSAGSSASGLGANATGGAPTSVDTPGGKGYGSEQGAKQYPLGSTHTETKKALGELKSMSIAVLANSSKNIDVASVETYLKGYVGGKGADPNFSVSVTPVKFDETAEKMAKTSADAASSSARMQQMLSIVPVLALLVVGFMVVKSIGKAAKGSPNVLIGALSGGQMVGLGGGRSAGHGSAIVSALDQGEDHNKFNYFSSCRSHLLITSIIDFCLFLSINRFYYEKGFADF